MNPSILQLSTPAEVQALLAGAELLAVDLETCGPPGKGMDGALNPREGRIRLLQLHDGKRGVVVDCFEHPIQQFLPALETKILLAHNALFDLSFLWHSGLRNVPRTVCTYLLAQLLTAGEEARGFGRCSLVVCCKRWLDINVDKTEQTSDWSGPLSAEQIEYAYRDVEVLPPLFQALGDAIVKEGLTAVSDIELRCLPAWVWMSQSGAPFNREAWLKLADKAQLRRNQIGQQLDVLAPEKGTPGLFGPTEWWNWDSSQQVQEILDLLGYSVMTTQDAQLALLPGEFPAKLRDFRTQATLLKMYGSNWLASADVRGGRVFPGWRQIGTVSGRTSCETPNCQQIPRAPGYKRCFTASPDRVLVKADYGTLQMRIACNQAHDLAMFDVFAAEAQGGPDVHTATAMQLLGKPAASVTKTDRQIAKSAGFGLLFGMSAEGLRIYARTTFGVEFTKLDAEQHRARWLSLYSGIDRWHQQAYRSQANETRSRLGRRRRLLGYVPATFRLNTPVQADEADGFKTALALLWERRSGFPDAFPVLAVHDEIVMECPADQGEAVAAHLWQCMLDAMQPILDPVPCVVEAKVVQTWEG